MKGAGKIRLVVVKHNDQDTSLYTKRPDTIMVIYSNFWPNGFVCGDGWNQPVDEGQGVEEMIINEGEQLADYLKDKPNGFYEILAGVGMHSERTSYEYDEWETYWQLLDPAVKAVRYEHIIKLDKRDLIGGETFCLLDSLKDRNRQGQFPFWVDTAINQFMSEHEINARHAFALAKIDGSTYGPHLFDFKKMSPKELQNYIFMAMLHIDQEGQEAEPDSYQKKRYDRAQHIDKMVKTIQENRRYLFDTED